MYADKNIILASSSPRRQQFLKDIGLPFSVSPPHVDETPLPLEVPDVYVERVARDKWEMVSKKYPGSWVLSADTTVYLDREILGKPSNPGDALRMLMVLRGKTHRVATSYVLGKENDFIQKTVKTQVRFAYFSEKIARWYVDTKEPFDKAGGYGIQGKGAFLVASLQGSYTNVVGLPMAEVIESLHHFGIV